MKIFRRNWTTRPAACSDVIYLETAIMMQKIIRYVPSTKFLLNLRRHYLCLVFTGTVLTVEEVLLLGDALHAWVPERFKFGLLEIGYDLFFSSI